MRKKRILSEEHKRKIKEALIGKKRILSEQAIENLRKAASRRKGIKKGPRTDEDKEKIRNATVGKKKNNVFPNSSWFKKGHQPTHGFKKGNIPPYKGKKVPREIIDKVVKKLRARGKGRWCWKTKEWARQVKERDGQKCHDCLSIENLHAHHIVPWRKDESLRWDLSNGKTLCVRCHGIEEGFKKGHPGYKTAKKGKIPWNKGLTKNGHSKFY